MRRNIILVYVSAAIVLVFTAMGFYAKAPVSGFIIGAILAGGLVGFVLTAPVPWAPATILQIRNALVWTAVVVSIVVVPKFVLGLWSPELSLSLDRLSANSKKATVNYVDKKSLKSERESGTFGVVSSRVGVYDENGTIVTVNGTEALIREGVRVKAADLTGKPASGRLEGMTRIILPNSHGDFVDGNIVYIPSQKINWDGA